MILNMKRFIAAGILATVLLAGGCGKFVRDELLYLQSAIDDLSQKIDQRIEQIESLKGIVESIKDKGYITSVMEFTDEDGRSGYELTFSAKNGEEPTIIKLYHGANGQNGKDAEGPEITVRQNEEDGHWYWWIKGEGEEWQPVIDAEGNLMQVDGQNGKTPIPQINEEGFWVLSWDGGETWEETGWPAKGEDAFEIFSGDPAVYDDRVELTLADGTVLVLPIYREVDFELTLEGQDLEKKVLTVPGDTLFIRYVLKGTDAEKALLVAGTDGRFKTAIRQESDTTGVVNVICPDPFPVGGYIYVTVNDGDGRSLAKVIRFAQPSIQLEEKDFVSEAGAAADNEHKVTFAFVDPDDTNDFEVEAVPVFPEGVEPWMTVKTDMQEKCFSYDILENTGTGRSCVIKLYPKGFPGFVMKEMTVTQAGVPATGTGEGEGA